MKKAWKIEVTFQPSGKRILVDEKTSLFEAAQQAGVNIRSICGGKGNCGKCRVIVEKGEVSTDPSLDRQFFSQEEIDRGYHLACKTYVLSEAVVNIPPETRIEGQKILTTAIIPESEINPVCKKIFFKGGVPTYPHTGSPGEALLAAIEEKYAVKAEISKQAMKRLEEIGSGRDKGATVTLCQIHEMSEIIDIEKGDTSKRSFGLAIDIGTTKIAIYLVELSSGRIIDVGSDYNRQLAYGEDLLSRIDYGFRTRHGLTKLQTAVVDTINSLIDQIAARNGVEISEISGISVAGNTVMTHLFVGLDPAPLVDSNVKVSRDPIDVKADTLGVRANRNTTVFCLPCVSRFLGGDAIADVIASGLHNSDDISVLIDMGTNGEIILGSKGWLLSSSCAAGPAFEGWGIRFGMRSLEGAIEHIQITPNTLKPVYTVIGPEKTKPRGICGSGLIDALAEMYKARILDSLGKIRGDRDTPLIRKGDDGLEYFLIPAEHNDIGRDIVITQKDVDNLMDSKAATCAAIAVLMKKVGLTISDIDNLYLFGAFGNYVDLESAVTLGVFPEFPNAETVPLGNGSIAGAYLTLLSIEKRVEVERIAGDMTYYDLSADPDFMEEYSAALTIPGNPDLFPSARKK